jgi:hypothetical protein
VGSGFDLAGALEELKSLKSRLDDDKTARKVVVPTLLLIQAERLGVNEETLRHFAAVASGAVGGDGHVSVALKRSWFNQRQARNRPALGGLRHRGGGERRRECVASYRAASADRSRVELAARLLRLAGVSAEVKKVGDGNEWRVIATSNRLAAGRR